MGQYGGEGGRGRVLKKVAVSATKTALRSHSIQWISGPAPESPSYSVDKNGTQVRKNWKRHAERERGGGGGGEGRERRGEVVIQDGGQKKKRVGWKKRNYYIDR